jgi:MFS family permease
MSDTRSESRPEAARTTGAYIYERLEAMLLTPVRSMRWAYLPLLMVYFAYGATGLIAIAQTFWVKKALTLTPAELASIAVWLNIPWTVKMVFGELVDTVSVFGSRRRGYVLIGGGLVAAGMLLLASAAGGWLPGIPPAVLYVAASLIMVVGLVVQDVVADAMSTEVVARHDASGAPRPKEEVDRELGMVQVLGRLALSLGAFITAGLGGWLAAMFSYSTVFLIGLVVPAISVTGALMVRLETPERRPIDWKILGGGIAFGAFVLAVGLGQVPFGPELVFAVSMSVVVWMLHRVAASTEPETRIKIAIAAIIIFLFRSAPSAGQGYSWFTIDVLGFDEAFLGTLAQIGAALALVAAWLMSDAITRQPVTRVLLWLVIAGFFISLPGFGLTLGLHRWTEAVLGFGARSIAIVDAAVASPLVQISMIPMLTLIAIHAPPGHRAIWFALMASLMNLALSAGELQTKYLNLLLPVDRGQYANLPALYALALGIGTLVPLVAILVLGKRLR